MVFEMPRIPTDSYWAVRDAVAARFHLATHNEMVTNGYDIIFQDYQLGEQIVGLEWDNWTGFTVVSETAASESLVEEIGAWLQQSQWATE
jgi:hypothetical protein